MTAARGVATLSESARTVPRVRGRWVATIALFGLVPAVTVLVFFVAAIEDDAVAMDFPQFYRAAKEMLRGENPYPLEGVPEAVWGGPYPYPPLPALATIPLTVLPLKVAELVVMVALLGVALSIPFVLGVRDWRCYGVCVIWPPVLSAIQTGNLTLLLALGAAIAWRLRDRVWPSTLGVGVGLAAKFFLWPLVVWLAGTRRIRAAVLSVAVGAGLLLLSWAVIGFAGFTGYPDRLRRLDQALGLDSYTVHVLGLDVGLPSIVARALWLGVGLILLALVVLLARRGDERRAFIIAIAASLALTPIVWLHYFALLLVVVTVAQPRLGIAWFVPFGMIVTPGSGHPTPFETSATLAVATLTVLVALRAATSTGRDRRSSTPVRTSPVETAA